MPSAADTSTPFRELPGRPRVVLPKWTASKNEEITYSLKTCRGVQQNVVHDVSADVLTGTAACGGRGSWCAEILVAFCTVSYAGY